MATLVLKSLEARPALSTRNTAGNVAPIGVPLLVWSSTGSYNDGSGSKNPVTFKTPDNTATPYSPAFTLAAACTFTSQYAAKAYDAVASLPIGPSGSLVPIFRSSGNFVPAPLPSPPAPVPLECKNFQFDAGLNLPPSCPVPFRVTGDFHWKVSVVGLPDIIAAQTTRLEFFYARAAAPAGPSYITIPMTRTRVDLKGIYPIGLLRQFFPSPAEFIPVAGFGAVYARWYALRTVTAVWAWGNPEGKGGPQYDALSGKSYYNMTGLGGGFDLTGWLQVAVKACNCYDLAGIVQLGCSLLQYSNGGEVLDSRWVFQLPNGFILPCLLYGWDVSIPYPTGVNNPFFLAPGAGKPYIAPPETTGRSPFSNHAWVEVIPDPANPGTRTVLDATTATPDSHGICYPESGSNPRLAYAGAHIDYAVDPSGTRTGNTDNYILGVAPSTGNCYTNDAFYTVYSGFPTGAQGRVGVWNADGLNPPALLESMVGSSLAPGLTSEIEILLVKGQNPVRLGPAFSDSVISDGRLASIIQGDESNLVYRDGKTQTAEEITVLRMTVDGAKYTETETTTITIELQIFNTAAFARTAFLYALTSYQPFTRLSDHFSALSTPLGETSLIDISGRFLHLLRGNHYVQLNLTPPRVIAPDPAFMEALEPIAQRLDAYLSAHTIPPGEHRTPNLSLGTPASASFRVGDVITLSADGDDFAHIDGTSSNCAAVICAGRKGKTKQVEFFAVGEGETELSLHVAHKETLAPKTETYTVTVTAAAEGETL